MTESDVQLAPEGSGPPVATLELVRPQPVDASGNVSADRTVHQQVITIADRRGELADTEWEAEVLSELRAIKDVLQLVLAAVT